MATNKRLYRIFRFCALLSLLPQVVVAETTGTLEQPRDTAEAPQERNQIAEEARASELETEDPLAREQSVLVEAPEEVIARPDELRLYGSVRVRYRDAGTGTFWGDGGSRFGVSGRWQFRPATWLIGRVEAGINLLDTADLVFNRGDRPPGTKIGDSIFRRLLYLGIETPDVNVTVGKNWSTYYRVSSFTDRFQGTGASASGTFNAGTDGGYTGTGRADRVL